MGVVANGDLKKARSLGRYHVSKKFTRRLQNFERRRSISKLHGECLSKEKYSGERERGIGGVNVLDKDKS